MLARPTQNNRPILNAVAWISLGLLAYTPLANVFHSYFPFRILGYAVWVTVLPTVVALGCYLGLLVENGGKSGIWTGGLAVLALLVTFLREQYIEPGGRDLLGGLNQLRYFVLLPVYIQTWREVSSLPWTGRWIRRIMIATGCGLGLLGALHLTGLPTFYQNFDSDFGEETTGTVDMSQARYAGTLGGANVNGNAIVLAMLALGLVKLSSRQKWELLLAPLLFVGLVSSGSRLALGFGLASMVVAAFYNRFQISTRLGMLAALAALTILGLSPALESTQQISERYRQLNEGDLRLQKSQIAIEALAEGPKNLALGVSTYQIVLDAQNENQFSDNSILLLATNAGLPAACLFVAGVFLVAREKGRKASLLLKFIWLYYFATFLLNNALLWNPWLYMAGAVYWLIAAEAAPARAAGSAGSEADPRLAAGTVLGSEPSR